MSIALLAALALALAAFAALRMTLRRTCASAFRHGLADARTLSSQAIRDKFAAYLRPMRPMDAAAYVHGVRCGLRNGIDPSHAEREFRRAFRSGAITREGTWIRQLGADEALRDFRLPKRRSGAAATA
jgi:hypothetical protein